MADVTSDQALNENSDGSWVSIMWNLELCCAYESFVSSSQTLEALVCLQYSGGEGLKADYCRQCSVALNVEVKASVRITDWQVHPGSRYQSKHALLHCELPMSLFPSKCVLHFFSM